jgi:hypothetical protein
VVNFEKVSQVAKKATFSNTSTQLPLDIINLTFSKATLIEKFYNQQMQTFLTGFFVLLMIVMLFAGINFISKLVRRTYYFQWSNLQNIIFLVTFGILSTGFIQNINLPIISSLAPILREAGHFAPIVILFGLIMVFQSLLIARFALIKNVILLYMVVFLGVNLFVYSTSLPVINNAAVRDKFQATKQFQLRDESQYRVLSYPFFNQFAINDFPTNQQNKFNLNNSGWDSYSAFSDQDVFIPKLKRGDFSDTFTYQLLTNKDLSVLEERNVRYIYDFSKVYQSNIEKYQPPSYYNNNVRLVKNNVTFFNELIANNPGRITKLSPTIYKLNKTSPRIVSKNLEFTTISNTEYRLKIKNLTGRNVVTFLDSYNKGWKFKPLTYQESTCTPIYTNADLTSSECELVSTQAHDENQKDLSIDHYANSLGYLDIGQ